MDCQEEKKLDNLLTAEQVAKRFHVNIQWVYDRVKPENSKDPLPCVKMGPRLIRFKENEIVEWLERRKRKIF